ncbi:ATP-dependent Clp protease proteolytic subunit [Brevibacterium daeguense]|uniref:ATP-dependent Clp protease proteolytic subunit n=1 Tax=Brevibacterium daeguense TaxID=909936 RepID=UPI0034DF1721
MLRQPQIEGGRASIPDLIVAADEVIRQRDEVEQILAAGTGCSSEQLRQDLDRDLVLTAEQALAYCLIDRVAASRRTP